MTITRNYEYPCEKCGTISNVETQDSITTWLYPDLVLKVYNDGYYFECSNCKHKNQIIKDILVNTRKGMFNLDTSISLEEKRSLLVKYGVVDEQGNVLKQQKVPPSQGQHDPAIAPMMKRIEKIVEDFRDEILNKEKEGKG